MAAPTQNSAPSKGGNPSDWTTDDAIALRQYVVSNPKFLRALAARRPKIEGHTMESRAVTGSDANGFLACIEAIETMQADLNAGAEDAAFLDNTGNE